MPLTQLGDIRRRRSDYGHHAVVAASWHAGHNGPHASTTINRTARKHKGKEEDLCPYGLCPGNEEAGL